MKDPLLTVPEAARQKSMSRSAIYAAIARGKLPRRYSKGSLVVRQSDLRAWEEEKGRRGPRKGSTLSQEHKARIAQAQTLRWKKRKEPQASPSSESL